MAVTPQFRAAAFCLLLGVACGVRAQEQKPAPGPENSSGTPTASPRDAAKKSDGNGGTPNPTSETQVPMSKTEKTAIKRVTGIGGVFIKSKDPKKLRAWYKIHLGIDVQTWGGASFRWIDGAGAPANGTTAWYVGDGSHFAPSEAPFMIHYRVANLDALLRALREEGCHVLDKVEESDFGKFGWVIDPDGNKVELWQHPKGQ